MCQSPLYVPSSLHHAYNNDKSRCPPRPRFRTMMNHRDITHSSQPSYSISLYQTHTHRTGDKHDVAHHHIRREDDYVVPPTAVSEWVKSMCFGSTSGGSRTKHNSRAWQPSVGNVRCVMSSLFLRKKLVSHWCYCEGVVWGRWGFVLSKRSRFETLDIHARGFGIR